MAENCRKSLGRAFASLLILAVASPLRADTQDSAFDGAVRLIRRAINLTKDKPLSADIDAGQVITALRSSKDKDVLPVFEKLRQSKVVDNQIFAMVAATILMEDPKRIDVKLLLSGTDQVLVGSAIASLIDNNMFKNEHLVQIMNEASDGSFRAMAAGELIHRNELKDHAPLKKLLDDKKNIVRYYAGMTLLTAGDPAEAALAMTALKDLSSQHDLHELTIQALMLVRSQKENITAALPWVTQIAADEKTDEGLRYTALAAAFTLKSPEAPRVLVDMIAKQHETIQQVKLGLISIEYADQLNPGMLEPLAKSRSSLVKTIASLAQKAAEGGDNTSGLLALLKEGHPIVLDWALAYADRTQGDRRLALRTALANQSTIVDNVRDRDYDRAALAVQKMLDEDGAPGRKTVINLLTSDNRAVVEATLAGLYRSKAENQSELVMKIWDGLTKSTSTETAANYAALILARDGRKEPIKWLPAMIDGGTVSGQGLRTLAGWYYAKLQGKSGELLAAALAD